VHIDRVAIGEAVDLHLLVCIRNVGAQMLDRRPDGEPFVMRCVRRQVCDIVQEYGRTHSVENRRMTRCNNNHTRLSKISMSSVPEVGLGIGK